MNINHLGHMTKMAIPFKNPQNCRTYFNETWHLTFVPKVLQCVNSHGLDLLYDKVSIGRCTFVKILFEAKT